MPACNWVPAGEENGHKWERGYVDGALVAVRCANCGEMPLNVMDDKFHAAPCRAVFGGSGQIEPRPGGMRDRDPRDPTQE